MEKFLSGKKKDWIKTWLKLPKILHEWHHLEDYPVAYFLELVIVLFLIAKKYLWQPRNANNLQGNECDNEQSLNRFWHHCVCIAKWLKYLLWICYAWHDLHMESFTTMQLMGLFQWWNVWDFEFGISMLRPKYQGFVSVSKSISKLVSKSVSKLVSKSVSK